MKQWGWCRLLNPNISGSYTYTPATCVNTDHMYFTNLPVTEIRTDIIRERIVYWQYTLTSGLSTARSHTLHTRPCLCGFNGIHLVLVLHDESSHTSQPCQGEATWKVLEKQNTFLMLYIDDFINVPKLYSFSLISFCYLSPPLLTTMRRSSLLS